MEADTNYSQCNSLKTQILLMQILNFSACHLAPNTRIIKNITWKSVCVNVCCINGTQLGCSIKNIKMQIHGNGISQKILKCHGMDILK